MNTLEKLKRDYLKKSFEEDHLREIIWEELFEKRIIWEKEIIWEKRAKEKYLIRRDETEYWESWDIKREQIKEFHWLKFLAFVSSVSIFCFVFSYQLFLLRFSLKWFLSNDFSRMIFSNDSSQMISLKWFSQIISFKLFKRIQRNFSDDYYKDYYKSSSYTYI